MHGGMRQAFEPHSGALAVSFAGAACACIPEGCAKVARGGSAPLVSWPLNFSFPLSVLTPAG